MSKRFSCIGHITRDVIITPQSTVHMPGGTSYYFAHAIRHLSTENFTLVTALEEADMAVVDEIKGYGIDVKVLPSRHSVCFENKYGASTDERTQRVSEKADPFTIEGLKDLQTDFIHLGTLLADDFSLETMKYLSTKGLLSVDVQGFLRKVVGDQVIAIDWDEKMEACKFIHTLKANEKEMVVLTGETEPEEAALLLADWGIKEVILTLGEHGSLIYSQGEFHKIPAYPTLNVVDATGCGDTYMAGFLYKRAQGASIDDAAKYASAMCTIKLQGHGPFNGTDAQVMSIVTGK